MADRQRTHRDVLADRIETWADTEDWKVFDYVDRLLNDLDAAGYEVVRTGEMDELRNECLRWQRYVSIVDPNTDPDFEPPYAPDDLPLDDEGGS